MNEEKDVKKDEEIVAKAKKVKEVETPVKSGLKIQRRHCEKLVATLYRQAVRSIWTNTYC